MRCRTEHLSIVINYVFFLEILSFDQFGSRYQGNSSNKTSKKARRKSEKNNIQTATFFECMPLILSKGDGRIFDAISYQHLSLHFLRCVAYNLRWRRDCTLPLVGGSSNAPPPKVFPTLSKNGGAERHRFWHSLSLINFAPFLEILGLGHFRSGHQTRSSDPT